MGRPPPAAGVRVRQSTVPRRLPRRALAVLLLQGRPHLPPGNALRRHGWLAQDGPDCEL